MKTSDNGLKFIMQEEGCKLTAYRLKGEIYYTIGVGHHSKDVKKGQKITMAQAMALLRADVVPCEVAIRENIHLKLTQNMFDALVSYLFNRGANKVKDLKDCSTLTELGNRLVIKWGTATLYKKQLIARREREKVLFFTNFKEQKLTYSTDPAQSRASKYNRKYTTTANVNLRTGASTSKAIITTVPKNTTVVCYGYYTNNWLYVSVNGKVGYINMSYIK